MKKKKLSKNNLIADYNTKESILFIDRGRLDAAYTNSYFVAAVNNKYKKKIYVLNTYKDNRITKIYNSLGFRYFVDISLYKILFNPYTLTKCFGIFLVCLINLKKKGFMWFINSFRVNKILIGDLIYDTYLRPNNNYLNPKIDFFFIKKLISAIYKTIKINEFLKKYNVKIIITGTEHYAYDSGLATRISTYKKNIRNFTWNSPVKESYIEIVEFNRRTKLIGHNSLQDKIILKRFNNLKINKKKINEFFYNRKKLKTSNFYTRDSFGRANQGNGDKFLEKIDKLKKNKYEKILLYASHRLSDVTHLLGITYCFQDYYDQFKETLDYVYKNDDNNIWIFRPHPSSNLDIERNHLYSLFKKYKKKNIFFCPRNVPVEKLKKICDFVVSSRGTIALEFLCEGKPVILAGVPRYFHKSLGFKCYLNKSEYFKVLSNLHTIKNPSTKAINLAKKILFFYENGMHIKRFIRFKNYKKDNLAKKIFNFTFDLRNKSNNNFNFFKTYLSKNLDKSYFFSLVKRVI